MAKVVFTDLIRYEPYVRKMTTDRHESITGSLEGKGPLTGMKV
jgi:hypothetical protein